MAVVGVLADIVNAHLDQSPLTGFLQNTRFKIRRENLG
jgi:hypothetical protein